MPVLKTLEAIQSPHKQDSTFSNACTVINKQLLREIRQLEMLERCVGVLKLLMTSVILLSIIESLPHSCIYDQVNNITISLIFNH